MNLKQDIPERIRWFDGLEIGPQHFQQNSQRQESLLRYNIEQSTLFSWGIQHLDYDKTALQEGVFLITRLEAIMPDGLIVSYEEDPAEKGRSRDQLKVDLNKQRDLCKKSGLMLSLIVAAEDGMSLIGKNQSERFIETQENEIKVLKPRLKLKILDKDSSDISRLPLAKIGYNVGGYTLQDYIPPITRISSSPYILQNCTTLVKKIRAKLEFLLSKSKIESLNKSTGLILETRNLIRSLQSGLPQFEADMGCRDLHPFNLARSLAQLLGFIGSVNHNRLMPKIPVYDHKDILGSIGVLMKYINQIIDDHVHESYSVLPFSLNLDDWSFSLGMAEEWIEGDLVISIKGEKGMIKDEIESWLDNCIIGSESMIPALRTKRIQGAKWEPYEGNEDLLPPEETYLFKILNDSEFIIGGEPLIILNSVTDSDTKKAIEIIFYLKNTGKRETPDQNKS